ncbi:alpha-amylase family glycosyl hydrolase [Acidicapsa dinghuensis]|uniref:Alpha-amylase family glycosyl hydrolase n=1 Tax=Acidicapsa dinghuensis TaxID=2218256 RepID=A0ABW1EFZ8_9BACT|nr:alpha-amylase family glycosyl hydrolase [Acidicapsa dinghuensis]
MQNLEWWKRAVIYEVYPRSFQDSDGDGIGDLKGILSRLDYLVALGVDAIWISPIYPSPMADFGYDISDYCAIDRLFGAMDDFDRLLAEVHRRGLRLILDFVPNHTSDQHPWFLESRSSRETVKRDWYIWRDEPNNWTSNFGGSAWEFDATTGQYYYHSFLKQQPDLNWRNRGVIDAMFDVLRFWLQKGVDGFRVDVMWLMIKDDQFRDNPPNPGFRLGSPSNHRFLSVYNSDRPEVHAIVNEMRSVVDEFLDRVLIGEIYLPIPQLMSYYGQDLKGANLPFNFHLLQCPWSAPVVAQVISEYSLALPEGAWPNWVLGNHDQPRIASRVGKDQARVAAMLLLSLPGTITLYYGEEIGMINASIPPEQVQDPAEKNEPGIGQGRDPERTPMRWDQHVGAGFTTGVPWLPLGEDLNETNVAFEIHDGKSILQLYRRFVALRKAHPTLVSGKLHQIQVDGNVLRFRRSGAEEIEVILNMSREQIAVPTTRATVLAGTHMDCEGRVISELSTLRGAEGVLLLLD